MSSADPFLFDGACHCGGIAVALAFTTDAASTQVRACQCGFCTRQGAMTVSDPAGRARFAIVRDRLVKYEFATRTATSLVCRVCGVYAGAMLSDGARTWSIANVRGLAIAAFTGRTPEPSHYEHESAVERISRRKLRWTPTEIVFQS